jgi:hypothetical protein
MTVHVTIELTDEEHERLSALAAFEGVDLQSLLLARKSQLLGDDDDLRKAIDEAEEDIRQGRYMELAEAEQVLRAQLQGRRTP